MFFILRGIFASSNPVISGKLSEAGIATTNLVGSDRCYNFFIANLAPVTLGNIVGAALFVLELYWYVYLRGLLCKVKNK